MYLFLEFEEDLDLAVRTIREAGEDVDATVTIRQHTHAIYRDF